MTQPDDSRGHSGDTPSELLEQVLRGERFIGVPPGGYIASLLTPCLCAAAVSLGFHLSSGVAPLNTTEPDLGPVVWTLGIAFAVGALPVAWHLLIAIGHARFRRYLMVYVRTLWVVWGLATGARTLGWLPAPLGIVAAGGAALAACSSILHSRSYLAVTSFMSLKRQYRLKAKERAAASLSRSQR